MNNPAPRPHRLMPRWLRGLISTLRTPVAWLGRGWGWRLRRFRSPNRYDHGLVIILPGIESQSFLNHDVAWGLSDAGWPGAMEIHDWTTSITLLFLYHLRGWQRNLRQARRIAARIADYQARYPERPVHIIGHSGGGAMAVLVLEALGESATVSSTILLAAALSPRYRLSRALSKAESGLWNFWSPLDVIFLGAGTLLFGTLDGRISLSCGMIGFREPRDLTEDERELYRSRLHERCWSPEMIASFHAGGHFGCVNRIFIETWIAPLLQRAAPNAH